MALAPPKMSCERNMFTPSDGTAMMKQIQATHAPDGRELSVKPLLHFVEDIFLRYSTDIVQHQGAHQAQLDELDEKALQNGFHDKIKMLSYDINKISCEMSSKCSEGGDAHATTVAILNLVSNYAWDEKVVLALAGFALNYGEFWLVAQLRLTNPLAKAAALLKQLPDIIERADHNPKPKFEAPSGLIRAMMEVAKCIVEFKELPSQYITPDTPEMLTATAVYWTIMSIVACTSQIMGLIGMGHEYIPSLDQCCLSTEAWDLTCYAHKLDNIQSHLKTLLDLCIKHIDEKRTMAAFQTIMSLYEDFHVDNIKILKALIYAKDDQLPLFDGSAKKRASLDVLRRRRVLLLITDLEIPHGELSVLQQMYSEVRVQPGRPESQYEVVWLPIVDRSSQLNESKEKMFQEFREMMPWYSVYHPSLLDVAVIRYIKEVWHFNKKPMIVVLDWQGKVVNPNAIHMMWIWGSLAFPFTSSREEELWKEETWKIDLLADSIDPMIQSWMEQDRYICLYGGEDMEWIRKFTTTAKHVANKATIQLEMLDVGKSNPREKVRKNSNLIQSEKLSHVLPDLGWIWFFWMRLESMWHSKVQHKRTVGNDTIMQEIMSMLIFDGSDQGWAVISKGPGEMAKEKGETILRTFVEFDSWSENATVEGFLPAIMKYLHDNHSASHCNRLILSGTTGSVPERVDCVECGRPMEKFIMYRCCTY